MQTAPEVSSCVKLDGSTHCAVGTTADDASRDEVLPSDIAGRSQLNYWGRWVRRLDRTADPSGARPCGRRDRKYLPCGQ